MRWLAILNPAAHDGRYRNHIHWVARELGRTAGAECFWTRRPGHALEAAQNSRGFDGCIAVGGDGTIAEVVNGLNLQQQCLGIVPVGTGNGFARDLGLRDSHSALNAIQQLHLAPVDLIQTRFRTGGQWQAHRLISTAAVGYVAEVVKQAVGPLKHWGHFRYGIAAYLQRRQKRLRDLPVRLRIDDGPWKDEIVTNLVVNNTRHAGHFCLFPRARLQDGRLNLLYGRTDHVSHLIENIAILTRTYFFERFHRQEAEKVEVELAQPVTLMLDGELAGEADALRFQVEAGCLRCCCQGRRARGE